jgi:hypothetical protein
LITRVVFALALTGCYSFTVAGRARTVDRGHLELFAAPGLSGIAVAHADTDINARITVGARYGATESLDLSASAGDSGASIATRVQLVRAPRDRIAFELLVAPGLQYTLTNKLAFELPVVAGLALPNGDELVLAPRFVEQLELGLGHPVQFVFAGASIGYAWQLRAHVAVMPELGVLGNIYSTPGYASFTAGGPGLEATVALLWDR